MCFLKQRLMQFYELEGVHPEFQRPARCAVVGSSGAQLAHRAGQDIDGHEVVIRFNDAPTVGFEEHVGKHTTFRFGWNTCLGPRDCKTHSAIPDAPAIWPKAFYHLYPRNVKEPHQQALSDLYSTHFGQEEDHNPTTGFYGMLLALSHCAAVDAYEMAPSDAARQSAYSYYREGDPGEALRVPHEHGFFPMEHDLWARLSTAGDDARRSAGRTSYPGFSQLTCPAAGASAPSLGILAARARLRGGAGAVTLLQTGEPA